VVNSSASTLKKLRELLGTPKASHTTTDYESKNVKVLKKCEDIWTISSQAPYFF